MPNYLQNESFLQKSEDKYWTPYSNDPGFEGSGQIPSKYGGSAHKANLSRVQESAEQAE